MVCISSHIMHVKKLPNNGWDFENYNFPFFMSPLQKKIQSILHANIQFDDKFLRYSGVGAPDLCMSRFKYGQEHDLWAQNT